MRAETSVSSLSSEWFVAAGEIIMSIGGQSLTKAVLEIVGAFGGVIEDRSPMTVKN